MLNLSVASLLVQTFVGASCAQTVSFPASRPTEAANVPHDFIAFGFETAFLNDYDNNFSRNLIKSVADRMSLAPIIRIGGTSGDEVTYKPQQKEKRSCMSGDCPNGSSAAFALGPSYFNGFKSFPNARFTVQAPMGNRTSKQGHHTDYDLGPSLDYVSLAIKAIGGPGPQLHAIALGNEVNLYDVNGTEYAHAATTRGVAIAKNLTLTGGGATIFEACDTASGNWADGNVDRTVSPSFL